MNTPAEQLAQHIALQDARRSELRVRVEAALAGKTSFVLEVGCGHGHFLTAYADAHREEVCIGIDIASDRIARADRKREHSGLTNLHFIRADANLLIDVLPTPVTLPTVFILFPDPWPKLRHHKHRVVQPGFLSRLAARLGETGRLYFRTDYLPYFEFVRAALLIHPHLELADEPWRFEYATVFQNRADGYYSLIAKVRRHPA